LTNFLTTKSFHVKMGRARLSFRLEMSSSRDLDFCMGSALYSVDSKQIVTVEMSISYLKGVREGNLRGFGEIKKVGSKLCFAECKIFNKGSELVLKHFQFASVI